MALLSQKSLTGRVEMSVGILGKLRNEYYFENTEELGLPTLRLESLEVHVN